MHTNWVNELKFFVITQIEHTFQRGLRFYFIENILKLVTDVTVLESHCTQFS